MKKKFEINHNKWKKLLIAVLLLLFLCLFSGIIAFKHYYNMMDIQMKTEILDESDESKLAKEEQIEEKQEEKTDADLFSGKEINEKSFNIMLVGVDSRKDDFKGRTDSMILLHINPDTKKIITTSFLRDMYVQIPGHGSNRLNAAYVFGGPDLLFETISKNIGIDIANYVTLNFWLVIDVLNDLGGVDIELTADEIEIMNGYIEEHNRILKKEEGTDYLSAEDAGLCHLNGNQALAYSRIRYIGTDFARSGRQRQIISICIDKLKQMDVKEINAILEKYLPHVKTNLTEKDITTLLFMMLELKDYTKENYVIPVDGTWENANANGMSVLKVDFEANKNAWYEMIKE